MFGDPFITPAVCLTLVTVFGDPFITPAVRLTPMNLPIRDETAIIIRNASLHAIGNVRNINSRQSFVIRLSTQRAAMSVFQHFEHRHFTVSIHKDIILFKDNIVFIRFGFVFAFVSRDRLSVVGDPFITPLVRLTPIRWQKRDETAISIKKALLHAIGKVCSITTEQSCVVRLNTQRLDMSRSQQFELRHCTACKREDIFACI